MIHGMMIVRNESQRYLDSVLQQMIKICDRLVVLDDCSSDDTAQICVDYGAEVYTTSEQEWIKNEVSLRKKLWEKTIKETKQNDWIICLDADEIIPDKHLPYLDYILETVSNEVDAIGFKLHDMWNETQYRDDEYWQAHKHYWTMAIRYHEYKEYFWNEKSLHCGRFPQNGAKAMLPTEIPILHMGWSREKDRLNKYNRYMKIDSDGVHGWKEQYQSILDKNPTLKNFYF